MPTSSIATTTVIEFRPYGFDFIGPSKFIYNSLMGGGWEEFVAKVTFWWDVYSVVAILLSCIFFVGFVYAQIRFSELLAVEQMALREAEAQWAARYSKKTTHNARWESIQERIKENNPASWRVAIIEADIMLDETLSKAGYVGNSLGEKLKSANHSSFTTIQDAWNAHKVRNEIAHVGSDFILTKKVAQDTLVQFERVFREFGVI